jgi:hypothetical protein
MLYKAGSTSVSGDIRIEDDSGLPVTGLVAATFPALTYSLAGPNADVSISLSDLALITTAYTSGGVKERGGGVYRLDYPNGMLTTGGVVTLRGEASGKRVIAENLWIVAFDPQAATNLGLSALPTANPGASNGVLIAGTNVATTIQGLSLTGVAASGATPATAGMTVTGGAASTTGGGVAAAAIVATGGAGAASTNGAASGATFAGGGTNTVASTADGITATGASNGNGLTAAHAGTGKDLNATTTPLTLAKTTNITGFNDITAAAAATAVWQDTTGGDFTVASSIGKSLYTSGNAPGTSAGLPLTSSIPTVAQNATGVWQDTTSGDFTVANSIGKSLSPATLGTAPGAAGGLFIAGTNAATTVNGLTLNGAAASGATPANPGLAVTGGAASTTGGGTAAPGIKVTGGAGAASTNGAASGATFAGGGTNTVASTADGVTATGTSNGNGLTASHAGTGLDLNAQTTNALQVNATAINAVSTSSVTTVNANIGETQPINFTGTGASALVKCDTVDVAGSAAAGSLVAIVWDSSTSGHTGAGTFGGLLNSAGTAGDPWATLIPGSYGAGTAGHRLGNIPDAVAGTASGLPLTSSIPTVAQNATGVWQDTTSGDFTVASSIGKSLYTSGNAPGAASGLALVGSNVGTATSVTGAVGSVTGNVGGSVGSVTAAVTVGTNNDKTGYSLASTGLDAVSTADPGSVASTFTQRMNQLWRRFFKRVKNDKAGLTITTYRDDNTTVETTQTYTSAAGADDVGAAS